MPPGPTAANVNKSHPGRSRSCKSTCKKEEQLRGYDREATVDWLGKLSGTPRSGERREKLARVQKHREAYVKQRRGRARGAARRVVRGFAIEPNQALPRCKKQIEVMAGLGGKSFGTKDKSASTPTIRGKGSTRRPSRWESINDEIKSAEQMAKLIGGELEVLEDRVETRPNRVRRANRRPRPRTQRTLVDSLKTHRDGPAGGTFGALILLISFWEFPIPADRFS